MPALKTKMVPADHLHANPWNPNQQGPRVQAAVRESLATYGFIDPVTVRPHPELPDQYQVIDGEHRWQAAADLGIKTVPVVVLDLPDAAAKKLTIVLNETRGTADTVDLAYLLREIQAEVPDASALMDALPYTEGELDALLEMATDGWTPTDPVPAGDDGDDGWATVRLRMPEAAALAWQSAQEAFYEKHDKPDNADVAAGLFAEAAAASWLSGPQE